MLPVEVSDPNEKTSPDHEVEEGMFEGSQVPGQEYGKTGRFTDADFFGVGVNDLVRFTPNPRAHRGVIEGEVVNIFTRRGKKYADILVRSPKKTLYEGVPMEDIIGVSSPDYSSTRSFSVAASSAPDWEDLSRRLNRHFRFTVGWDAEELEKQVADGEAIIDIRASSNERERKRDLQELKRKFPELKLEDWWDYGAVGQKEHFITGYLKRARVVASPSRIVRSFAWRPDDPAEKKRLAEAVRRVKALVDQGWTSSQAVSNVANKFLDPTPNDAIKNKYALLLARAYFEEHGRFPDGGVWGDFRGRNTYTSWPRSHARTATTLEIGLSPHHLSPGTVQNILDEMRRERIIMEWLDTNRLWSQNKAIVSAAKKFLKKRGIPFRIGRGASSRVAFQSLTSKIALRHLEARYSVDNQQDLKEIKEKLQKTYTSVPEKAVRQAIYVWNSVFDRYGDEGRAWASLYGVMNRRGLKKKKKPGKKKASFSGRVASVSMTDQVLDYFRKADVKGFADYLIKKHGPDASEIAYEYEDGIDELFDKGALVESDFDYLGQRFLKKVVRLIDSHYRKGIPLDQRGYMDFEGNPVEGEVLEAIAEADPKKLFQALWKEVGEDADYFMDSLHGVVREVEEDEGIDLKNLIRDASRLVYEHKNKLEKAAIRKSPWTKELKALGYAFTSTVAPNDVPYIKYQARRKKGMYVSVYLEDIGGRLGHMRTSLTEREAQQRGTDLKNVFKALDKMGAKLVKRGLGPGKKKPWIDYDGWAY